MYVYVHTPYSQTHYIIHLCVTPRAHNAQCTLYKEGKQIGRWVEGQTNTYVEDKNHEDNRKEGSVSN